MKVQFISLCLGLFLISLNSAIADTPSFDLSVPSGETLTVEQYPAASKTLLIWLPSSRGFGENMPQLAAEIAKSGVTVWAAMLHDSYVIPPGRGSLDEIETDDLTALIEEAKRQGYQKVFVLGVYRTAAIALKMAYRWQQIQGQAGILRGLLLFSPNLKKPLDELGEDTGLIELVHFSNLPIFILQSEYSTNFARVSDLLQQLSQGGSPVYLQVLRGVINGYYRRPQEDLKEADLAARAALPHRVAQAIRLLQNTIPAAFDGSFQLDQPKNLGESQVKKVEPGLHPYKGREKSIPLKLQSLEGQSYDLNDFAGQVVLVNFWATWCAPCVEEMPSLSRLNEKMRDKPFTLLAVNIGEQPRVIRQFLQKIPVNFDILLDPDSQAVRDWKVYAYPSNYVIDPQGVIRLAYRGALHWDSPAVIESLESLIELDKPN